MIDISQLTALISAFRVETEKSVIKRVQYQTCLSIAEREQIIQRIHIARDRRQDLPVHHRPAGHRHRRERVQHHPRLEGDPPAVPLHL